MIGAIGLVVWNADEHSEACWLGYVHWLILVIVDSCKPVNVCCWSLWCYSAFAYLCIMHLFASKVVIASETNACKWDSNWTEILLILVGLPKLMHAMKFRLNVILELLDQLDDESYRDREVEAHSLLLMIDLKVVFCLLSIQDLTS